MRANVVVIGLGVYLSGWTFVACDRHDDAAATAPTSSSSASVVMAASSSTSAASSAGSAIANDQRAHQIYSQRCTSCHGPSGKGDGQMAAMLAPRPRDYSDPIWQKGTTDDAIRKVIVEGGASVGKSAVMPANADLGSQPEVVDALVRLVRSFGGATAP